MTNPTANKDEILANLLEETQGSIFQIHAMSDEGYVQICGDLFVNDTLWLGGLRSATVITHEQLEACAAHGMGIPSVANGHGELSSLIPMKEAKKKSIAYLLNSVELMTALVEKI